MNDQKKILVIDDEKDLVSAIQLLLESKGYGVVTAHDGQEGLDKAHAEHPDLIILDLMLPKMDGYKVCGLLKRDVRYAEIPIIMFTARTRSEDVKLSEEVGADRYVTKPFDAAVLLEKISELI